MAWIFQKIENIKNSVFYDLESSLSWELNMQKYNQLIKENIDWKLYVQYCIWQCDLYVDVDLIVTTIQSIYGKEIDETTIITYMDSVAENHHIFVF